MHTSGFLNVVMAKLLNHFLAIFIEDDANHYELLWNVVRMHNALPSTGFTTKHFYSVARTERYFPYIPFDEDKETYNANPDENTNQITS